jgi:L-threonylcarbamoyladenylate synthase
MRTERLSTDATSIARAAEILRAGGLVAFPTETVYGLGARADDPRAARAIFEAKGRPPGNPLIVHALDAEAARGLAAAWPEEAARLAQAFWPGPLTLIVERRRERVVDEVAAGGDSVAIRVPMHPIARAILAATGVPIAAPSANRSTTISPTTADHVAKSLAGRIDAIVDGGATDQGLESTIVDVRRSPATLLRPGALHAEAIARRVPLSGRERLVTPEGERAPSPGTHARHYAPRARVAIVAPDTVPAEVARAAGGGARVGALEYGHAAGAGALAEVLPGDPVGYAAGLYAALHRLEDAGCEAIVVAAVPADAAWDAIRDRLQRASAPA